MDSLTDEDAALIAAARARLSPRVLSPTVEAGGVAAALRSRDGAIWAGVCIDAACGIGFCAEHAAIAAMVTAGESRIDTIVAVAEDGRILPPCGRCRELILQVDPGNGATRVILPGGVMRAQALLPDHWLLHRPEAP
jgi:cytidine deaminase